MLLIKTSANTLEAVIREAKHALHGKPHDAKPGEIILVAQTKATLRHAQKPIRWIMEYVGTRSDSDNETDGIWGKHWEYIVDAQNVRAVEPFDLDDIKVTNKNYASTQTFGYLEPEDESAVLQWIGESAENRYDERDEILEAFSGGSTIDLDELIKRLDKKYSGSPQYLRRVVNQVKRPSALRDAIIQRDGSTCKICKNEGFRKKGGGMFAETHHMIELNKEAPQTLQSWNVLVVCPTCHRKLHYADVDTQFLNPGWKITINGKSHLVR